MFNADLESMTRSQIANRKSKLPSTVITTTSRSRSTSASKVFVTRKGAINAEEGRYGIIPGSMGAKSFIIRGSRKSAERSTPARTVRDARCRVPRRRQKFTRDDLKEQTAGVECRKDKGVVDEIPGAYKDIEEVMRAQNDLVEVVAELKQVICVKG